MKKDHTNIKQGYNPSFNKKEEQINKSRVDPEQDIHELDMEILNNSHGMKDEKPFCQSLPSTKDPIKYSFEEHHSFFKQKSAKFYNAWSLRQKERSL